MNKNFVIFGALFIFAVSLVFAGVTGYVLKEGDSIGKIKIDGILENKIIVGDEVYSKGDIISKEGKSYKVKEIKPKSWFLGSDEVELEEVESPYVSNRNREIAPIINGSEGNWSEGNFTIFDNKVLFKKGLLSRGIVSFSNYGPFKGAFTSLNPSYLEIVQKKNLGYRIGFNWDVAGFGNVLVFSRAQEENKGNFAFMGDTVIHGNVRIKQDLEVEDEAVVGNLQVTDESGEGNAYACFSRIGILFRSNKPCK